MSADAVLAFDEVLTKTLEVALAMPQEDLEELGTEGLLSRIIRQGPSHIRMAILKDFSDVLNSGMRGGKGMREGLADALFDAFQEVTEPEEAAALWAVNWAPLLDEQRWETIEYLAYGLPEDDIEDCWPEADTNGIDTNG